MARIVVNHPEEFCHRCLGSNFSWHIDSAVWNAVMRPEGQEEWLWSEIICPQCFSELFEEKFGLAHFELLLSPDTKGARAFRMATAAVVWPLDRPWGSENAEPATERMNVGSES